LCVAVRVSGSREVVWRHGVEKVVRRVLWSEGLVPERRGKVPVARGAVVVTVVVDAREAEKNRGEREL